MTDGSPAGASKEYTLSVHLDEFHSQAMCIVSTKKAHNSLLRDYPSYNCVTPTKCMTKLIIRLMVKYRPNYLNMRLFPPPSRTSTQTQDLPLPKLAYGPEVEHIKSMEIQKQLALYGFGFLDLVLMEPVSEAH
ncbi:hypothetical protein Fot_10524 [Forsythia ovata]|uniref:Uncharacterized protein n=1 Tax=Forsythia ovata TaxID=205694 RepID=A0ABD1WH40_9LAMI